MIDNIVNNLENDSILPVENCEKKNWTKSSWRNFKISQQPKYKDNDHLEKIEKKISLLPNIIDHYEIIKLKEKLLLCHEDKSFIIQVGDCAERFIDAKENIIKRQILSHILSYHTKKDVIIIGRIAGQYAKPRSNSYEIIDSGGKLNVIYFTEKIEAYRGDIINDFTPIKEKRYPDPERMLQAYYNSIATINQINHWNLYGDKSIEKFKFLLTENKNEIKSDLLFKNLEYYYSNYPVDTVNPESNNIFTSHEGLLLNYEECFVRKIYDDYYNLSTHFLWLGERTRNKDEAHVEFLRGLSNPIGIKLGPRNNLDELIDIIKILNPKNEKGKIVLITRIGWENAEIFLESLCEKIKLSGVNVIFLCDPNHGNTKIHDISGKKVRYFEELKKEIIITQKVLANNLMVLSGIHLEASCFNVTECLGGLGFEVNEIIEESYTTYCDPRLNMTQTMELCDCIGKVFSC